MDPNNNSSTPEGASVRGKKRGGHVSSIDFRPCEVCGGTSTGYHFGAITCEACKSFYRRTMKNSTMYTCFGEEKGKACVLRLVKGGVAPCPACRWKRCVEINMSLDAVKKGRYTHSKKAETISISKQYWKSQGHGDLKGQGRVKVEGHTNSQDVKNKEQVQEVTSQTEPPTTVSTWNMTSSMTSSLAQEHEEAVTSSDLDLLTFDPDDGNRSAMAAENFSGGVGGLQSVGFVTCDRSIEKSAKVQNLQEMRGAQNLQQGASSQCFDRDPREQSNQIFGGKSIENTAAEQCLQNHTSACPEPGGFIASLLQLGEPDKNVGNPPPEDTTSIENILLKELHADLPRIDIFHLDMADEDTHLNKIIEVVTAAFDQQNFLNKGFLSKISSLQYKHIKEREFNDAEFGHLPVLALKDHKNFFNETGIDIDGRLDKLTCFVASLHAVIPKFINFMKGIPGFLALSLNDQKAMIKNTNVVMMVTIYFPCHNLESGVTTSPFEKEKDGTTYKCVDHKIKNAMMGPEGVRQWHLLSRTLQDLELTDQENALMCAVCALHPDACETQEGKTKCFIIHNKLYNALRRVLRRRCEPEETNRILSIIELNVCETLHKFAARNMRYAWKPIFDEYFEVLKPTDLVMEWFDLYG